jgi:cytidylate kinase
LAQVLDELVRVQFQRWERSRRSAAAEKPRPCVTLSRLPGAGADAFGRELAERLGYAFFGIEIVDHIARETGLRHELVAGVDEHVRGRIERYVIDGFRGSRFTESDYLRHVVRTIAALGERGAAVILGRGSSFILPPERALRVLLTAPREIRRERIAKQANLTRAAADARLDELDAERREFLVHHFGRNPDAPEHYDLMLNLGTMSAEAALDLCEIALRARFGGAR